MNKFQFTINENGNVTKVPFEGDIVLAISPDEHGVLETVIEETYTNFDNSRNSGLYKAYQALGLGQNVAISAFSTDGVECKVFNIESVSKINPAITPDEDFKGVKFVLRVS